MAKKKSRRKSSSRSILYPRYLAAGPGGRRAMPSLPVRRFGPPLTRAYLTEPAFKLSAPPKKRKASKRKVSSSKRFLGRMPFTRAYPTARVTGLAHRLGPTMHRKPLPSLADKYGLDLPYLQARGLTPESTRLLRGASLPPALKKAPKRKASKRKASKHKAAKKPRISRSYRKSRKTRQKSKWLLTCRRAKGVRGRCPNKPYRYLLKLGKRTIAKSGSLSAVKADKLRAKRWTKTTKGRKLRILKVVRKAARRKSRKAK